MFEKLIDNMLVWQNNAEKKLKEQEERDKRIFSPLYLTLEKEAKTLAASCKKNAVHHREREKYYIIELENSEKELCFS